MPILSKLSQCIASFAVVNEELHVGSATCEMVTRRRITNILHYIRMRFNSLLGPINTILVILMKASILTRLYLYGAPVRVE